MKRGELWTVAGGGDLSGKPRPAVVLQSDEFQAIDSVTVCLVTSEEVGGLVARLLVQPDVRNGLQEQSHLMVDKVTTLRRSRFGQRIGELSAEDMRRLSRALMIFLDLVADSAPPGRETEPR